MATIVTRAGKGAPLTHVEVDANFTNLNTDKIQSGDSVASLDINGGTIDGTVIGGSTPAAISGTTGTFSGNFTVSAGSGNGIFVEDNSNFGSSPFVKVRGNRSDGNTSQSFSGKLLLEGYRTDAAVANAKNIGTVAFGGNHTDGSAANILYPASISGTSEGTFSNATTMPTALTFFTGSTGRADTTPNVTFGTERMRITSAGSVGIGTSSPSVELDVNGSIIARTALTSLGTLAVSDAINYNGASNFFIRSRLNGGIVQIGTETPAGSLYYPITINGASDFTAFNTSTSEAMRITSAGNVGIGTNAPGFPLDVQSDGGGATISSRLLNTGTTAADDAALRIGTSGTAGDTSIFFGDGDSATVGRVTYNHTNDRMEFFTNSTQQVNIDSNGNVGIGTASPAATFHVNAGLANLAGLFESTDAGATITLIDNSTTGGSVAEHGLNTVGDQLEIRAVDNLSFETAGSERMNIGLSGDVGIGTAAPARLLHVAGAGHFDGILYNYNDVRVNDNGSTPSASSNSAATAGARIRGDEGSHIFSAVADQVLLINRITNDGALITFYGQGNAEGSISVSGSTVSYNGGHLSRWSQTADNTRIDLLKGTVMTNLDQMAVWGDENNEQLNCMAVSSVEGDPNVAGAFVNWDNDDDEYTNDMNVAMTGDFIIRIAQGTTVQRGDLLMSAGDGTAKPQGDDIVRSKTIAKVTSTHVTCTYEDGSYCVPCVLMAC